MIEITKDGIMISADHLFKWTDGKTGDECSVRAGDFKAGSGLEWAVCFGCKQGLGDAYAGKDVSDDEARTKRDAKRERMLAGTLGTGGGGKAADLVGKEAVAMILTETGMTAKAFKDAYGTGRKAVTAYVMAAVNAALAEEEGERDAEEIDRIMAANEARIIKAAEAEIEKRKRGKRTAIKLAV